jgi:hypothetical protein
MIKVDVHTTSGRGFSPEELAERCADKIIHVSDAADPVIQQQARAFRKQVVAVVTAFERCSTKRPNNSLQCVSRCGATPTRRTH